MRGNGWKQNSLFSSVSLKARVPRNQPLRKIREMVDEALEGLGPDFQQMYSQVCRPSIPPERLLRALLLQVLSSVRSERMLMEQLDYNLLFRWFVVLGVDEEVWHPTTFTQNREPLLEEVTDIEEIEIGELQPERKNGNDDGGDLPLIS